MKHLLILLTIALLSCNNRATDTATTESTEAPAPATSPEPATNDQTSTGQLSAGDPYPLTGTYWKLVAINGESVSGKTAKEIHLTFDPSSPQVKGHTGCSMVMAEAKISGTNSMRFINFINTTTDCATPEIETSFMKALEGINEYAIRADVLFLSKSGAEPTMKFIGRK